jgi:quercetin dioxygenase-like cupin family protein
MTEPVAVTESDPVWFLGTLVRTRLTGAQTDGRFSLQEALLPRGAAPPLHSHPQDETLVVLEGEVTFWLGDYDAPACRGRAGATVYAPAGTPHSFRVESDTARMLYLSTPAGIDEYIAALAEPAQWPWLQPPHDGPRVPLDRLAAVEREHGVVRHAPPPTREGNR